MPFPNGFFSAYGPNRTDDGTSVGATSSSLSGRLRLRRSSKHPCCYGGLLPAAASAGIPEGVGELPIMAWLLIKGAKVQGLAALAS